jgi:hypothetical protein
LGNLRALRATLRATLRVTLSVSLRVDLRVDLRLTLISYEQILSTVSHFLGRVAIDVHPITDDL